MQVQKIPGMAHRFHRRSIIAPSPGWWTGSPHACITAACRSYAR